VSTFGWDPSKNVVVAGFGQPCASAGAPIPALWAMPPKACTKCGVCVGCKNKKKCLESPQGASSGTVRRATAELSKRKLSERDVVSPTPFAFSSQHDQSIQSRLAKKARAYVESSWAEAKKVSSWFLVH